MAHGLEVYNATGVARLTITDRLHRIVMTGVVNIMHSAYADISCPGMSNNGEWYVLIVTRENPCVPVIGAGTFRINSSGTYSTTPAPFYYTVFRR